MHSELKKPQSEIISPPVDILMGLEKIKCEVKRKKTNPKRAIKDLQLIQNTLICSLYNEDCSYRHLQVIKHKHVRFIYFTLLCYA